MALDTVALEAALPAETATATGGTITAAQVFVDRVPQRRADNAEAWWLPGLINPEDPPGFGAVRAATSYRLTFHLGPEGSRTDLKQLVEQVRDHFQGFKRPASITGHLWSEVTEAIIDVNAQEGLALAGSVTVVFHGED